MAKSVYWCFCARKVAWSQCRLSNLFFFSCFATQTLHNLWPTSLAHSIKRESPNISKVQIAVHRIFAFWNDKIAWLQSWFFGVFLQQKCRDRNFSFFYFLLCRLADLYTLWHNSLAHSIKQKWCYRIIFSFKIIKLRDCKIGLLMFLRNKGCVIAMSVIWFFGITAQTLYTLWHTSLVHSIFNAEVPKYVYSRNRVTELFALWNDKVAWSQIGFLMFCARKVAWLQCR